MGRINIDKYKSKCAYCDKEFYVNYKDKKYCSRVCDSERRKKPKEHSKEYQKEWRLKNKEKIKQYNREYMNEWRKKHPDSWMKSWEKRYNENKEKYIKQVRDWEKANPEKHKINKQKHRIGRAKEYAKEYRERNLEKLKQYDREWAHNNPDKVRVKNAERYHRMNLSINKFTDKDINNLKVRQKGKCYWCKKSYNKYHIDHVWPLSKGGDNSSGNIVISCPSCNLKKNNKTPMEFAGKLL